MIELLKRFGRPFRRELTLGPASKLIEVVFDLLSPLVVTLMIDRGVGERNVEAPLDVRRPARDHGARGLRLHARLPKNGRSRLSGTGHQHARRAVRPHQRVLLCRARPIWHAVAHHAHHQRRQPGAARHRPGGPPAHALSAPGLGFHGGGPAHRCEARSDLPGIYTAHRRDLLVRHGALHPVL